ncbi:uncharacterized protein LOC142620822 [Castanea sativa]|uniref:uncharacterized protein LOC142620822 n=1 Tax=Castanea sativa TaxID=21020 RepID=UPI003F652852
MVGQDSGADIMYPDLFKGLNLKLEDLTAYDSPLISFEGKAVIGKRCFTLFLGFIIDRMHHYLQKLIGLRSSVGASKEEVERLQMEKTELKEKEEKASEEIKRLQEEIASLSENLKKVKLESEEKDKRVESAESHVAALQKQAADLLLEYDRLLEDNQNLQTQAMGYR